MVSTTKTSIINVSLFCISLCICFFLVWVTETRYAHHPISLIKLQTVTAIASFFLLYKSTNSLSKKTILGSKKTPTLPQYINQLFFITASLLISILLMRIFLSQKMHIISIHSLIYLLLLIFGWKITIYYWQKIKNIHHTTLVVIALIVFAQLYAKISTSVIDISNIVEHQAIPHQEKWTQKMGGNQEFGWITTYAEFLKRHLNQDQVLLIPNQESPWLSVGNKWYFRWFMYPTRVVQNEDVYNTFTDVDALLLSPGLWQSIPPKMWPDFPLPEKSIQKIVFIDRDSLEETTITDHFFNTPITRQWGVIILK